MNIDYQERKVKKENKALKETLVFQVTQEMEGQVK